jgi:acetolactate synthase-1/2/3 large subunit
MMAAAKRPVFYTGGGVINSGPEASQLLRELVELTGFPDHLDADGPRRLSGERRELAGHAGHARHLRGQHGDARLRRHVCIGARFDDRITGRIDAFSPLAKKIHIDIDPSSINKTIKVDLAIIGDVGHVLEDMVRIWRSSSRSRTSRR